MTDPDKKKIVSYGIGIALFLSLTTFFLDICIFRISSITGIIILSGFAVLLCLFIYMAKMKFSFRELVLPVVIAFGAAVLVLILAAFAGNALIHDMPGTVTYTVSVNGLDRYNGGLATDIIVPLPMINGEQAFSDDELQYRQFGQWKSMLVVTPQGKMIAFQSLDRNLTNIHAQWFRESRKNTMKIDSSKDLLSPRINLTQVNYTRTVSPDVTGGGYVSKVYIEKEMRAFDEKNGTISFNISFFVSEGTTLGFLGKTYNAQVSEEIPAGFRQSVPVAVYIEKITG
ncbi:hypothetical protein Metfor_2000 [Methanoregula formicica SMSP]|uniref:Uncharacterized protein n=2 Tax=Methanoregula formicica TaxID=882104 RepID=L0HIU3_METFS|nr:hypothetical protein Metfor_2000 [Methanoregula formicica SMSP]